jgi:hypothetical protein
MIISTFKSVSKAYVDLKLDMDWEELVDLFLHHNDVEQKQDAELYNMAEFKDPTDLTCEPGRKYHYIDGVRQETYDIIPNTTRRCKSNVISVTGVVLDIDEHKTIDETIELLDGLEYVLYTTFRHTPEKHKFRVVIPFSRPLLAADIVGRQQDIIATLPSVDNCSFTVSQSFYFHSGKCDSIAFRNHGIMIDPYQFEYNPPPVYTPPVYENETTLDDEQKEAYKQAVVSSLLTCNGLHYAGKDANNKAVLTLVSICKSIGLSFGEYDAICAKMAHPESQLVKPDIRRMAWTGWEGNRIRRETRDQFIKEYGGIPLKVKEDWQTIRNTIIDKYKGNNNE